MKRRLEEEEDDDEEDDDEEDDDEEDDDEEDDDEEEEEDDDEEEDEEEEEEEDEDDDDDEEEDKNVGTAAPGCPSRRSPEISPLWALATTKQPLATIKANANLGRNLRSKRHGPIDFDCEVMIL